MEKKIICFIILLLCSLLGMGCATNANNNSSEKIENLQISVSGLQKEYKIIYISDLHIISDVNEVSEEHLQTVQDRKASMVNDEGKTADQYWIELVDEINEYNADIVLLGGDMLDFMSPSNVSCLKEGLERIKSPVMYVRADHDYANWYQETLSLETVNELSKKIDSNEEIFTREIGELLVIGINNSTSQITPSAYLKLEEVLHNNKKPVILLTHVPIQSKVNDELDNMSKAVWQDRALIWGNNCYYIPDQNTKQFIELIQNSDNNVVTILSGHLHFSYHGEFTQSITQHVFGAAYEGNIAVIQVSG